MRSSRTYAATTMNSDSTSSPTAGSTRSSPNSHSQCEPGVGGVKPALPLATQQRLADDPDVVVDVEGADPHWVPSGRIWPKKDKIATYRAVPLRARSVPCP